jgi:FOG: LysM repeat
VVKVSSHIDPEDLKYYVKANDPPPQNEHGGQHGGQHGGRPGGGQGGEHRGGGGRYGDRDRGRYRGRPRPYPYPYPYPYYGPPPAVGACPAGTAAYTVQPGDSLYAISSRYGIPPEEVVASNPGVDFNFLQVGQILCI